MSAILGASVGFGFAAFESAGYAFTALFMVEGLSLTQVVETEILRGLIAPFGHGLWTAILGGVLFFGSTRDHFAITVRLVLAYLGGVSSLHALWNGMHDIALILTLRMTEGEAYVPTPYGWLVKPTEEQVRLLPFLEITGLVLVWLFGIAWVLTLWRAAPPVGTPAGWQAVPRGQDL